MFRKKLLLNFRHNSSSRGFKIFWESRHKRVMHEKTLWLATPINAADSPRTWFVSSRSLSNLILKAIKNHFTARSNGAREAGQEILLPSLLNFLFYHILIPSSLMTEWAVWLCLDSCLVANNFWIWTNILYNANKHRKFFWAEKERRGDVRCFLTIH